MLVYEFDTLRRKRFVKYNTTMYNATTMAEIVNLRVVIITLTFKIKAWQNYHAINAYEFP